MRKLFFLLAAGIVFEANAEGRYYLVVNIKDKLEESRLKSLGFNNCKPINQNTLLCVESRDINHLMRLRDFLVSQKLDAKVVENLKKESTNTQQTSQKIVQPTEPQDLPQKKEHQLQTTKKDLKTTPIKKESTQVPAKQTKTTEIREKQNKSDIDKMIETKLRKEDETRESPKEEILSIISSKMVTSETKKQSIEEENLDKLDQELKNMYMYLNTNQLDKAAKIARTLLNTKYSTDAKFVLGIVNLKRENFKEACLIFSSLRNIKKEAKELEVDSCWVYYMQEGYDELDKGRLSEAIKNFEKSLSYKDNLESKIGIFYVYLKQKNFELAGKTVNELYNNFPNNRKVIRAYIDYLVETNKFDELKNFEPYLTEAEKRLLESRRVYSDLERANNLIKSGEFEKAENILKDLYLRSPSNIYVLLSLGYLYLEKGEMYTAENYYKNVLVYDRNNKDALKGLKAVYVKLGKYEDAIQIIERLKSLGVKDEDENKIKELLYTQKAQESFVLKDFSQAENYARQVIDLNPNNPTAYLILARISKEKGDEEEYFKLISKAYELQPENFGIKLAYMYGLVQLELFDQVRVLLGNIDRNSLSSEQKEELKQFYRTLYNKLASYYLKNKDYARAKKVALEGLEIFKIDSGLSEILGWSCYNLKEYECSRKSFEYVTATNPSNEMAKLGLAYTYLSVNERVKLMEILKALENSKDIKVLEGVANIYASLGKYSDAEKVVNKIERMQQSSDTVIKVESVKKEPEIPATQRQKVIEKEIPYILDDYKQSNKDVEKPYEKQEKRYSESKKREKDFSLSEKDDDDESIKSLKEKIQKEKQNYTSYAEVGVKFRDRSGESGKSKLTDTSPYTTVSYFLNERVNIQAGSYMTNLNSGKLADYDNFGSPQNEVVLREVPSSYTGAEPFLGINIEGERFILNSKVSSTPIVDNGVKENIVYMLEGKIKTEDTKAGIGIYRRPIRDSILSYTGTIDPYTTNTSWGRAVEEGVRVSYEKSDGDRLLIYSELNVGNIKGKDIQENKRINLIFMPKFNIGSVLSDKDFAGLFVMYDRFSKDQDCFYYGCGGYFSPKNLLIVAPMLEGYKYVSNDFGLHYKAFLGFLSMNYKGKTSTDISFDGYLGGIYRLHSNIFLNLGGEYRRTSKYNETFGSLSFQYFFGNRYNVTEKDLLRQEKEIYKTW